MNVLESVGLDGMGWALSFLLGLVINGVMLLFVCRMLVNVEDATLGRCLKLALALSVAGAVMMVAAYFFAMIPVAGPILWLIAYYKVIKGVIEGMLEITEGGLTIMIFYVLTQVCAILIIKQVA